MFIELRELLCSGAIRRHQLGAKDLLTPTSSKYQDKVLKVVHACMIRLFELRPAPCIY